MGKMVDNSGRPALLGRVYWCKSHHIDGLKQYLETQITANKNIAHRYAYTPIPPTSPAFHYYDLNAPKNKIPQILPDGTIHKVDNPIPPIKQTPAYDDGINTPISFTFTPSSPSTNKTPKNIPSSTPPSANNEIKINFFAEVFKKTVLFNDIPARGGDQTEDIHSSNSALPVEVALLYEDSSDRHRLLKQLQYYDTTFIDPHITLHETGSYLVLIASYLIGENAAGSRGYGRESPIDTMFYIHKDQANALGINTKLDLLGKWTEAGGPLYDVHPDRSDASKTSCQFSLGTGPVIPQPPNIYDPRPLQAAVRVLEGFELSYALFSASPKNGD